MQCEPIPTVNGVRGLANYGPQAILFTLGPNHTVQQYEMSPNRLVKQAQYNPMNPPPIPSKPSQATRIPGTAPPQPLPPRSESARSDRSAPVSLSTIQRTAEMSAIDHAHMARAEMGSPVSTSSRAESVSSISSSRFAYPRHLPSISSRAQSGTTFSTMSPSVVGRDSLFSGTSIYPSTASHASSRRSKGSRLRNEILRSPESNYIDLFPRTKHRLANVNYQEPAPFDQDHMSPDDLRRQMLSMVFGWDEDIEPLIRDELLHQPLGSTSAVLLAKWLGEVDSDAMAAAISSGSNGNSDWMMLALSTIGNNSSMGKMGQAFVQRLLAQGDFHTSATILLGMGDLEDAIEVYVSRCFYMEAILLTTLLFPQDWQRQAHLVQKWGEFVVENSQQSLAMRCFFATGVEPPLPWASPSIRTIETPSQAPSSISSMLSPPVSPPALERPHRMTPKSSALKVITSFDSNPPKNFKFPGLNSTECTPTIGPGVTPIAESALSPGGTPGGLNRVPHRGISGARTATPGGFLRNRLPSIGEFPLDVTLPPIQRPSKLPTPDNSGSDLEREKDRQPRTQSSEHKNSKDFSEEPPLLSSARYEPGSAVSRTPMTALPSSKSLRGETPLPAPNADAFTEAKEKSRNRNASRDRKPEGLHIRMPSQESIPGLSGRAVAGSGHSLRSSAVNSLPSARSDMRSDAKSPSVSGRSWASAKSPSISGRSIDQYISSIDEARSFPRKPKQSSRRRHDSREGRSRTGGKSRSRHRGETSEDRATDGRRYIRPAKRSPSSPVPMSPEHYTESVSTPGLDSVSGMRSPDLESRTGRSEASRHKGVSNLRSGSKASDWSYRTVRHRSPEGVYESQYGSKVSSRAPSPRAMLDPHARGRSKSKNRNGSTLRSPSSPLPVSPQAEYYQKSDADEDEDPLRIVDVNRQRLRSTHRSSSRRPKARGSSSRRDRSSDRHLRQPDDLYSRASETDEQQQQQPVSLLEPRRYSADEDQAPADQQKLERAQKKELAARELAARRESLLRNTGAPVILHPNDVSSSRPSVYRSQTDLSNTPTSWNPVSQIGLQQRSLQPHLAPENGESISRAASVGPYGLPATPRAMRHPRYDKSSDPIPAVPEFPDDVPLLPETYYTRAKELPRSMSAPIPEPLLPPAPIDLPPHPAFHKGLTKEKPYSSNFQPLGSIGQQRRKMSDDSSSMMRPSIDETLQAAVEHMQDMHVEEPPILPELQHLAGPPPPPPPPPQIPPPPPLNPFAKDVESSSQSSNSNVGMIQMVLDNEPEDEANVIEVPPLSIQSATATATAAAVAAAAAVPPPPPPPPHPVQRARSPLAAGPSSPPASITRSNSNHRRGRSGGIKGFTERLRSNSRGRNVAKDGGQQQHNGPSPYESVPPLYF